ncbi:DUF3179 domain-containing protein [Natronomonas sp.]|uniref:DUF3179 domain-containing protein n=1 Tax=Natronomonas sp. TaxID=2184060 RepID=UPI002FC33DF5
MNSTSRRRFLAVAGGGLGALAGCSSLQESPGGPSAGGDTDTPVPGTVPTADERLPLPMSPEALRDEARSGGPSKDGIPSIDQPRFVDAGDADFIDPGDPVFGVVRDDVAKAYPQKILVHHEIVNDELAGTPVSVTYCPLTGTVQGFERGGTTFGVSGRLINNNLVMYDRATETWWPQILATSIPGPWNETPDIESLREFRLVWTTWERWQTHRPETEVLSTDTGHARNYSGDPYGGYNPRTGYYKNDSLLFPALSDDDTFDRKTVVMGARTPNGAAAFLKDALRENGLMAGEIGGTPVLAVYDTGLDTAYVYRNVEEGSFELQDGTAVGEDGTRYDPDDLPLERIHTFDAMWFAWAGYYPETNVYE